MESNNKDQLGFTYTYSAREQAELRRIRDKYTTPTETEDKMARLRRLDASVTQAAQTVALVLGVIGTLLLGTGMSLVMTELGESLALSQGVSVAVGIALGAVGGLMAGIAYPIYCKMVKSRRKKLAPEIIRLADELMK